MSMCCVKMHLICQKFITIADWYSLRSATMKEFDSTDVRLEVYFTNLWIDGKKVIVFEESIFSRNFFFGGRALLQGDPRLSCGKRRSSLPNFITSLEVSK